MGRILTVLLLASISIFNFSRSSAGEATSVQAPVEPTQSTDLGSAPIDEKALLLQVFEKLKVPTHKYLGRKHCEWTIVKCNKSGQVTILTLNKMGLTGAIPVELADLKNLKQLHLDGNKFSGPIPAALGGLPNLEILSLMNNELTGEIPPELGNLKALRNLYLQNNQLTGEIPAGLGTLPNLQSLQLQQNSLSGKIPAGLRRIPTFYYELGPYRLGSKQKVTEKNKLTWE